MRKSFLLKKLSLCVICLINIVMSSAGQNADSSFKASGKLWVTVFVDYYYKSHADSLIRGGLNQYSNVEKGRNAFQFRRIYFGYNYNISPKFSAELLVASEENLTSSTGITGGDLLVNNKLSVYIKLANLRWKNIFKGTDLLIGQAPTPSFPLLIERIWSYRSVERTISDLRRTNSFDLGVSLQGKFDPLTENFGYDIMVGNGTASRPENDKFKTFYADVWAKFFNKKIVFNLYTDYQRQQYSLGFHHSSNMIKGFAAFNSELFTAGVEAFISKRKNDVVGINNNIADTLSSTATGVSFFVRGNIIKDRLAYFARIDNYNPDIKYEKYFYTNYKGLTPTYEPNNKETFITAGIDLTPLGDIHLIPNIWYMDYKSQKTGGREHDHDLVYRITVSYSFGR